MTSFECPREVEVAEAAAAGNWHGTTGNELLSHVAACETCRDLFEVAGAVREDFDRARRDAPIPPAGLVWWRAQLRARREGAEAAARPITYVQVITASLAAAMLFTLGGLLWPWLRASFGAIDDLTRVADVGRPWLPLALAVGGWLVLAPVLLLLALSDD
jgi:predicted anti-sigma-YlaC factor YlaD